MTRQNAQSRQLPQGKRQKIVAASFALGALLAVSLIVEYTITRSSAHALESPQWKAGTGDEVIVSPSTAGALLSIEGADHEGVDAYFDKASLGSSTRRLLQALNVDAPGDNEMLTWRSVNPEASGHTMIDVTFLSPQPGAEVHFASLDEGSNAILRVTVRHATLRVKLLVLRGDMSPSAASEQKSLEWGNGHRILPPGTFPIELDVPDGASIQFVFPVNEPHSSFYLGDFDNSAPARRRLAVRYIGIKPGDNKEYRTFACAADGDRIWWRLGDPAGDACVTAPRLFADKLLLSADTLVLSVEGTAYAAKDGKYDRWEWYAWMTRNPVFAAIGTALAGALVTWVGLKLKNVVIRKS
ncbi:hypothetical protein AB4Y44_13990 [Paraburkholderia sp. BR10937]|uniref:hypothetical protein n=1 Tax=Paraburkholderia sp. BR10937 TaxID=3236994 RepID=UPI0034D153BF